jgi:Zn-dependent protease with chaperone function
VDQKASGGESRGLISMWRIQRVISRFLSVLASGFVYFQLYIGPAILIIYSVVLILQEHNELISVVSRILILVLTILQLDFTIRQFNRTYRSYLIPPIASAGLIPLSPGMNVLFEQIWADVVTKLKIDARPIKLWYRPQKAEVNASAIMLDDGAHVLVSLGLLRALNRSPEIAQAVLFHEGAHLAQRDTRLWLKAGAFTDVIRRVALPIAIGISALQVIGAILGLLIAFRTAPVVESKLARDPDNQELQELKDEGDAIKEKATNDLCLAFAGPAFIVLMVAAVASVRRRSEFCADLAARAFCGPSGITSLLESAARQERRKLFDYFGSHPSAKRRLRALREMLGKVLLIKIGLIASVWVGLQYIGEIPLFFAWLFFLLCFAILLY